MSNAGSDIRMGSLVLGGNVFGWTVNQEDSFAILDRFVEGGGNAVDTADVYSAWIPGHEGGESETVIGNWLATRRGIRETFWLGTKVGQQKGFTGLKPANIKAALDESLRRLQTEQVDVYYAHVDDLDTPQEDYLLAFDELIKLGKIRSYALSNFTAERMSSAVRIADEAGINRPAFSQDHYNLVERGLEVDRLPVLREAGVREVPYFSLAGGFLTGKYRPGKPADSKRSDGTSPYAADPRNLKLLEVLDTIAQHHSATPAGISLAWLRQQDGVEAPIASARTLDQLDALLQTIDLRLADYELSELNDASAR